MLELGEGLGALGGPGRVTYGRMICWTERDGTRHSVTVGDCETREQALAEALAAARRLGWKPRRWWEWRRWGERATIDLR
jgi:hypothetical protein